MFRSLAFWTLLAYPRSRTWLCFGLVGLVNTSFGYTMFAMAFGPGAGWHNDPIRSIQLSDLAMARIPLRGHLLKFAAFYIVVLSLTEQRSGYCDGTAGLTSGPRPYSPADRRRFFSWQQDFVFDQTIGPA
jgi:hypothetical protein